MAHTQGALLRASPTQELANIANALEAKPRGKRDSYMARCPAHDDKSPSLTLDIGRNGQPVFHCFAGCSQHEVLEALEYRGLWSPKGEKRKEDVCPYTASQIEYYLWFYMVAKAGEKRGEPFTPEERKRYRISRECCLKYQPKRVLKIIGLSK